MDDKATWSAGIELSVPNLTGVEIKSFTTWVPCCKEKENHIVFSIEERLNASLVRIFVN